MKRLVFGICSFIVVFGTFILVNVLGYNNRMEEAEKLTEADFTTLDLTVDSIKPVIHTAFPRFIFKKPKYIQFLIYTKEKKYPFRTDDFQHFTYDLYDNINIDWREFQDVYEKVKRGDRIAIKVKNKDLQQIENSFGFGGILNQGLERRKSLFIFGVSRNDELLYYREINIAHHGHTDINRNKLNWIIVIIGVIGVFLIGWKLKILKV
ncbi:hypothetical protein [Sinomicrobium sp. M5D2P9]